MDEAAANGFVNTDVSSVLSEAAQVLARSEEALQARQAAVAAETATAALGAHPEESTKQEVEQ
jgi:hypothetical protein